MNRRSLIKSAATGLVAAAASLPARAAAAFQPDDELHKGIEKFLALPGSKSYLINIGTGGALGSLAYRAKHFIFIGSAFKTFVLAQYLRDLEAGSVDENTQLAIDDEVRTLGSPVFLHMAGTTPARSVLEAMITHSDNLSTDRILGVVGAANVRALVSAAGLSHNTLVPDSTRIFLYYLLGARNGTDLGWALLDYTFKHPLGPLRAPLNRVDSMASTAADLVLWYEQALAGAFFEKPATLTEFKRIQGMAGAIARTVPPNTPAWGKGGSISFNNFNAVSFAGQMMAGATTPVTFSFTANFPGPESGFNDVAAAFQDASATILAAIEQHSYWIVRDRPESQARNAVPSPCRHPPRRHGQAWPALRAEPAARAGGRGMRNALQPRAVVRAAAGRCGRAHHGLRRGQCRRRQFTRMVGGLPRHVGAGQRPQSGAASERRRTRSRPGYGSPYRSMC